MQVAPAVVPGTPRVKLVPVRLSLTRWHLAASKGFGSATDEASANESKPSSRGKQQGPRSSSTQAAPPTPTISAPSSSTPPTPTPKQQPPAAPSTSSSSSSSSGSNRASPAKPVATTPKVVVDRMFGRMITCAALPVMLGIGLLVGFYLLKTNAATKDSVPMWLVYVSQNLTFGGGLLGITYGIMSTSWDPSREGSVLGWDEFRTNLPAILNRDKTN